MKAQLAFGAVLCACVAFAAVPASGTGTTASPKVTGDYVEARTASVFAGACHYNGELVTTGEQAVVGWSVTSGDWKGASLAGVKAMAAIGSDKNLGDDKAERRSELVIDNSVSDSQAAAFTDMLRTECGKQMGSIVSVRRGAVTFAKDGRSYTVKSDGFAAMSVNPMPNDECCKQPSLVWYSPLAPIENRKVGYTVEASYSSAKVGDPWQRSDENSAFEGTFAYGVSDPGGRPVRWKMKRPLLSERPFSLRP